MDFKLIKFPGEKTTYIAPTWDEMNQLAFEISKKIIRAKLKFDRIVTLAKGGWPMTRSMVDFLSVDKVASIGVKFYNGIYKKLKQPQVYQDLSESIKGEKILLFDDVADSGGSLQFVEKYLQKHQPKSVTTATLLYKPWSTFKPNYYGAQTDAWIIFPYEAVDAINNLGKKWQQQGLAKAEIITRFRRLGINPAWIKFYFQDR